MKGSLLSLAFFGLLATAIPTNDKQARSFDAVASLSNEIAKRQDFPDTRNELGQCKPITVIFARGTGRACLWEHPVRRPLTYGTSSRGW